MARGCYTRAVADEGDEDGASRIRSIASGSVGNLIEWYDFYVYAAFSSYFASSFFPDRDPVATQLGAAGVFALGFLMRPLGGYWMGIYADRHGRRLALTVSVSLMCFGSLVIALCPTYARIGLAAPVVLLIARLLQGLSLGGEYGTSATYLSEVATREHRGFYSSFQYVTLILGQLLATSTLLVMQQLSDDTAWIDAWGWRIPFVIGALLAFVGFRLRRGMTETIGREAREIAATQDPIRALLAHPRAVLTVVGLTMGGTLAFYTYTVYMHRFLVSSVGLTREKTTLVSAAALLVFMAAQPLYGALSDRIGRRPLLIGFGLLGATCTHPLLQAMTTVRDPYAAFGLLLAALLIVSGYTSINAVVKAELFPAEIRALGVGLPYALAVSIFGGTAEYVATWLKSIGRESDYFVYVSVCIAISFVVYLRMPESSTEGTLRDE